MKWVRYVSVGFAHAIWLRVLVAAAAAGRCPDVVWLEATHVAVTPIARR